MKRIVILLQVQQRRIQKPCQTTKIERFAKIAVYYFRKTLYLTILDKRLWTFLGFFFSPLFNVEIYMILTEKLARSIFMFFSHSSTLNIWGRGIEKSLFTFYSRLCEVILDLEILWKKHSWLENCFCIYLSVSNFAPC